MYKVCTRVLLLRVLVQIQDKSLLSVLGGCPPPSNRTRSDVNVRFPADDSKIQFS